MQCTLWSLFVTVLFVNHGPVSGQQDVVDYLADHLLVNFEVITNPVAVSSSLYQGVIRLTNTGTEDVQNTDWEIYFCFIRVMFPDRITAEDPDASVEMGESKINVSHVNGCLYRLKPLTSFSGFTPDVEIELPFEASDWSVARTDVMPRWYVLSTNSEAKTIASTASEMLDFVSDFDTPEQWKRLVDLDLYNPRTPEERFNNNTAGDTGVPVKHVIPTPVMIECDDSLTVDVGTGDWLVVYTSDDVMAEAQYLAEKWKIAAVDITERPSDRYVQINIGDPRNDNDEGYNLAVMADISVINITANLNTGAFYGVQSLLSLSSLSSLIPQCNIMDYPRFPFRGMHLDVGRNFMEKEDVLRLLEVMAMYKLNKFHFHLTDDEGWRLEIPTLPDLSGIGASRCYDGFQEKECLISQLGSGPSKHTSGTGFYSVADYKDILSFALTHHIEVIPEFDMPGHGHAPIKAMEKRYEDLKDTDITEAMKYLLSDLNDTSKYLSVQLFRDNAINPCIESTYTFAEEIVKQVKAMHEDIQPLKIFHVGGDEVASTAWLNSTACHDLINTDPDLDFGPDIKDQLHRYFVLRVAQIVHNENLDIGSWEDGMNYLESPINRTDIPTENVYVNAWNNVWEWGSGDRAYIYANADYKVILSHATHYYFDHPQEPDPEERGYYWATRFSDIKKGFGYYPDDVYENIDIDRMGNVIDKEEFCKPEDICIPLEESKRNNVLGIQGHLWSETVRLRDQLESQIYPRMLALAERAWHKAQWEESKVDEDREQDWAAFANTLGYKDLKRLDEMGVTYYVPPPGAKITENEGIYNLEVNCILPGMPTFYSIDDGNTWTNIKGSVEIEAGTKVYVQIRSTDLSRSGRTIMIETSPAISKAYKNTLHQIMTVLPALLLFMR